RSYLNQVTDLQAQTLYLSAIAGGATGVGGLALLVIRKIDEHGLGHFLALAAGMMAAAALWSLTLPALQYEGAALYVLGAMAAGAGVMKALDFLLPHEHPHEYEGSKRAFRTALLMSSAIALHNLPEGFAVGATPADAAGGTALSIGLQNIPEGMIVATALWAAGMNKWFAAAIALATGLVEPVGAMAGLYVSDYFEMGSPIAMGLAAGAMFFVVWHEMWPEARKRLNSNKAQITLGAALVSTSLVLNWIGA
ncbi:MAG: ZIP family metal transporter, partial [Limnobacter sp.]|nr:ZIP family metal transporter [Limnobacter sp.]